MNAACYFCEGFCPAQHTTTTERRSWIGKPLPGKTVTINDFLSEFVSMPIEANKLSTFVCYTCHRGILTIDRWRCKLHEEEASLLTRLTDTSYIGQLLKHEDRRKRELSPPKTAVQSKRRPFTSTPVPGMEHNYVAPSTSQQTSSTQPGTYRQTSSTQPGTSRQTSSTQPGTSRQTSSTQPGISQQTSSTQPGISRQTSSTRPGTSRQTSSTRPGTSRQTSSTRPGTSRQTSSIQPGTSRRTSCTQRSSCRKNPSRIISKCQQGNNPSRIISKCRQGHGIRTALTPKLQPKGFKDEAVHSLLIGSYAAAVHTVVKKSRRGKKQILELMGRLARTEMVLFRQKRDITAVTARVNGASSENFSWHDVMREFETNLPILHLILCYTLTKKTETHKVRIDDNKVGALVPGLGIVLAMVAKMRSARFRLIPTLIGISLYKYGCGSTLLDAFQRIGFCHRANTVRGIVDRYGLEFNLDSLSVNSALESTSESDSSSE